MKSGVLSVVYLVFAAVVPLSMRAEDSSAETVPSMTDLRTGGREAMRQWIAVRSSTIRVESRRAARELEVCFELAAAVHNDGGGEVILDAVAEAEARFGAARASARDRLESARMAANLGAVYERLVGDRAKAREWYETALRQSPDDQVALEGLDRMDRAELIAARKTLEADRARELEAALKAMAENAPDRAVQPQTSTRE